VRPAIVKSRGGAVQRRARLTGSTPPPLRSSVSSASSAVKSPWPPPPATRW